MLSRFYAPALLASTFAALIVGAAPAGARGASPVLPAPLTPERLDAGRATLRVDPVLAAALASAADQAGEVVLMSLPLPDGPVDVSVRPVDIFTPDAKIIYAAAPGDERPLPRPDVRIYSGSLLGVPASRVFLALRGRGGAIAADGWVIAGGRTHLITSGDGSRESALVIDLASDAARALTVNTPPCDGALPPPGGALMQPFGRTPPERAFSCRALLLSVDADTEFTANLFSGNFTNSAAYATLLLGAVGEIYRRDVNVDLQVNYLRLWGPDDPYTATNNSNQIPEFAGYWENNMPRSAFPRDLAHLLSGRALGGGIAYLQSICQWWGYAVSANLRGSFPYPLQNNNWSNWDPMVVAHEIGHNVGSGHTHEPQFYNPPIDGCGNAYLNPPQTQNCTNANLGTIMSYCHICPGGMSNVQLTFGPRPSAAIRAFLDGPAASCSTGPNPSLAAAPTGAGVYGFGVAVTLSATPSGPGPYSYQWLLNGQPLPSTAAYSGQATNTLRIARMVRPAAGVYTVVVSNSCGAVTSQPVSVGIRCGGADIDVNGGVGANDLSAVLSTFGLAAADPNFIDQADIDRNGTVGANDLSILLSVFGASCP
ncbi:MAG: hypothetical protein IBJ11_08920 [Phycisphaerales bacterium]|nr:hypothetical protein [Phycisphaerales bacterium]